MNEKIQLKYIKDKEGITHLCYLYKVPRWVAGRIVYSKAWLSTITGRIICYVTPERIIINNLEDKLPIKARRKARTKRNDRINKIRVPL